MLVKVRFEKVRTSSLQVMVEMMMNKLERSPIQASTELKEIIFLQNLYEVARALNAKATNTKKKQTFSLKAAHAIVLLCLFQEYKQSSCPLEMSISVKYAEIIQQQIFNML